MNGTREPELRTALRKYFDDAQIDSFGEIISFIDGRVVRKACDIETRHREIDGFNGFSWALTLYLCQLIRFFGQSPREGRRNHAKGVNDGHKNEDRRMHGSFSGSVGAIRRVCSVR